MADEGDVRARAYAHCFDNVRNENEKEGKCLTSSLVFSTQRLITGPPKRQELALLHRTVSETEAPKKSSG